MIYDIVFWVVFWVVWLSFIIMCCYKTWRKSFRKGVVAGVESVSQATGVRILAAKDDAFREGAQCIYNYLIEKDCWPKHLEFKIEDNSIVIYDDSIDE